MMEMYNEAELLWKQMSPADWQTSVVLDAFEDYANGALCQWERVLGHLIRDVQLREREKEDMKKIHDLVESAYIQLKDGLEAVDRDREAMRAVQEIVPKTYDDVRTVQEVVEEAQSDVNSIQELMQKTRANMEGIYDSRSKIMAERKNLNILVFLDVSFYLTSIRKVKIHLDRLSEMESALAGLSQSLSPKFQPFVDALAHLESSEAKNGDRYLIGYGDINIKDNVCTYTFGGRDLYLATGLAVVKEAYDGTIGIMRSKLAEQKAEPEEPAPQTA
jgi:type I site-specific restriction endonuclease